MTLIPFELGGSSREVENVQKGGEIVEIFGELVHHGLIELVLSHDESTEQRWQILSSPGQWWNNDQRQVSEKRAIAPIT